MHVFENWTLRKSEIGFIYLESAIKITIPSEKKQSFLE